MAAHGMVLLTHTGEERAVEAGDAQELGNPLRLRPALAAGVRVVAAHCASLGVARDLDAPGEPRRSAFDLFLRLIGEEGSRGLLFGDLSGVLHFNRPPDRLRTLLERAGGDLRGRLVNGSDYPLPGVNIVIRTGQLVRRGHLTAAERAALNEIYALNPLLFDFVIKRTVRSLGDRERGFPSELFCEHPDLPLAPPPGAPDVPAADVPAAEKETPT
jgi:mannonate dehydratase